MPLKWLRGVNPYVFNYLGKLRIGPNTPPAHFQPQARRFTQRLAAGERIELAGEALDEHAINEASRKLLDPGARAEELVLAHPQQSQAASSLKAVVDQIQREAVLNELSTPSLVDPAAIYWFLPNPSPDAVELPDFRALGLVMAGDKEDLDLDIVFDE
jgi:hypothetical protein